MNTGRGGKGRRPSWNTKRLRKDKLREYLEETRLIDELGWAKSAGSLGDTLRTMGWKVVAVHDHSMSGWGHTRTTNSMYWSNVKLSVLRRMPQSTVEIHVLKGYFSAAQGKENS